MAKEENRAAVRDTYHTLLESFHLVKAYEVLWPDALPPGLLQGTVGGVAIGKESPGASRWKI